MTTPAPGPFQTEQQARTFAHAIVPPDPDEGIMTAAQNREVLHRACEQAGVEVGAFDARILNWLADWEDATCGVIAGLILRAAGQRPGGAS